MNMLADFTAASRELMTVLGDSDEAAIVRGDAAPATVQLFVDDALQELGQHGRIVGNKRVVAAMNTDWLFARGDLVTVRGATRKVEELLTNDGIVNAVVLHG